MKFKLETVNRIKSEARKNNNVNIPLYISTYMTRYSLHYEDKNLDIGAFVVDIEFNDSIKEIFDLMRVLGNCTSIYIVVLNFIDYDKYIESFSNDLEKLEKYKRTIELQRVISCRGLIGKTNNLDYRCYHRKHLKKGYQEVWSRPLIGFDSVISERKH